MGRVIKTNLGKYANPKLAQSAKAAVLASVIEYLNGEEFVRIVTAPLTYKSPDFVSSTEVELGVMGVSFSPTNARQRCVRRCTPSFATPDAACSEDVGRYSTCANAEEALLQSGGTKYSLVLLTLVHRGKSNGFLCLRL